MNRFVYLLCAALLTGPALAAGASTDTEKRIAQIRQALLPQVLVTGETPKTTPLADRMAELNVPGVSIAVIHDGRIEWARGFGVKSVGGPPVTAETLFQAASISKPVFALAVHRLVEEGKLNLDTNVNDYLESWKLPDNEFTREQKVTLRRILSHTAGLTVHGFPGYEAGAPLPSVTQILDGAPPANTAAIRVDVVPGTMHRYSGGGYTLAQLLVQDVTGQPLPKLMHDLVLAPLGMNHSTYEQPLAGSRSGEVALPHGGDGAPIAGGPHVYPEMAAAGLWTTPSDLARYALGVREALAGKSKVISAATARAMLTRQIGDHALGPVVGGSTARKYYTHNGGNMGYRCVLVAYEDGEGAVVMTSGDNGGGLMYEVLRTIAHVYRWPDFGPPTRTIASVKPAVLDRLIGVYELEDQSVYVVRKDGGKLVGNIIGNGPVELFPSAQNELFAREDDVIVRFDAGQDGVIDTMKHRAYGWERAGKRVDEARARGVLAGVERAARRIQEQKADPRSEAALRKLIAGIASGEPDYASMSIKLGDITREQLKGLQQWFTGMGKLEAVTFQKVADNGADEFDVDFASGKLKMQVGFGEDGRMEIINLWPR
ncbi:MAG TPA: serine hydrolase [Steroidobacteraceae bacterium]